MKSLNRILLFICFLFALALLVVATVSPTYLEDTNPAIIVGALAVIAATISAWTSVRLIERDEDSKKPTLRLELDFSRYGLIQLKLVNYGGTIASNISLNWTRSPKDEEGADIFPESETLEVLLPGEAVGKLLGRGFALLERGDTIYSGSAVFFDVKGKRYKETVAVDFEKYRNVLDFRSEDVKAFYELQKLPKSLTELNKTLKRIEAKIGNSEE